MSTDKSSLLKSGAVVSAGVLCSRVLGFIRDVVIAHFLGTGFIAEAFFVAQRIPNVFRDLVGEGAANTAIVPVVTEYQQKKSTAEWQELFNVIMAWGGIILGAVTIAGVLAAPWIVRLMAPGFAENPDQFQLTVDLTRLMFPYLILIGLVAFQTGVLYSLQSFFAPAFGPCLYNIALILSAAAAWLLSWPIAYALAFGALLGGVWQLLAQWMALRKKQVYWHWPKTLNHEGARKVWALLLPRIWGSGVYQLNILIDTFCASLAAIVGSGGIAAIYYANRIIQFPLGVFVYAVFSVSLPSLSRLAAAGDMPKFKETLNFALRNVMLVLVPCAVVFCLLSRWIIHIIFERGAFDAYSTDLTGQVLFFSALGLPFYGAARILASAFYALQDTRTPVKIATVCLVINAVLNFILMYPLKVGGIALASSIASLVNAVMLWTILKKKLNPYP